MRIGNGSIAKMKGSCREDELQKSSLHNSIVASFNWLVLWSSIKHPRVYFTTPLTARKKSKNKQILMITLSPISIDFINVILALLVCIILRHFCFSFSAMRLQSVSEAVRLSNGSPHNLFVNESQSQHLMALAKAKIHKYLMLKHIQSYSQGDCLSCFT